MVTCTHRSGLTSVSSGNLVCEKRGEQGINPIGGNSHFLRHVEPPVGVINKVKNGNDSSAGSVQRPEPHRMHILQ